MAQYNKPDWKARAKSLLESDFFVDFEEPTVESDSPVGIEERKLKTWLCWYDNDVVGTVEAFDQDEAAEKFIEKYAEKCIFDHWDHDWWVEEATEEDLVDLGLTEEVKEPDNAVVDCKVNKVIAHCEDEKPVDCLGKKKPLEKPLTEESEIKTFKISYRENGVSKSFTVQAKNKAEAEKIAWSRIDVDDIYVTELTEELEEAVDNYTMLKAVSWAANNLTEFFKIVRDKTPAPGTPEFNKVKLAAYKELKARYKLTQKDAADIMVKAYSLWLKLYN